MTRAADESTLARVVQLVEEAKKRRAPVVRQADRYAQYFLPALLLAAGATYYFTSDWLRTVAVLIVGCPCALILATPGLLGPVGAAVVHQVASFLVMVNSVRLLKVERPRGQRGWLSRTLAKTPLLPWWWSLTDWLRGLDPARGFGWLWDHRRWILKSSVATAAAVWLLSGVYILQPGEVGIIERFGRKVLPYTEPGFHYALPFPNAAEVQFEFADRNFKPGSNYYYYTRVVQTDGQVAWSSPIWVE